METVTTRLLLGTWIPGLLTLLAQRSLRRRGLGPLANGALFALGLVGLGLLGLGIGVGVGLRVF